MQTYDIEPVLDAAFELARKAVLPLGHADARHRLQRMFPRLSTDEVATLYGRATDLVGACYDFGDACLAQRITEGQALVSLRDRFPGFSDKTYAQALALGYFLAR